MLPRVPPQILFLFSTAIPADILPWKRSAGDGFSEKRTELGPSIATDNIKNQELTIRLLKIIFYRLVARLDLLNFPCQLLIGQFSIVKQALEMMTEADGIRREVARRQDELTPRKRSIESDIPLVQIQGKVHKRIIGVLPDPTDERRPTVTTKEDRSGWLTGMPPTYFTKPYQLKREPDTALHFGVLLINHIQRTGEQFGNIRTFSDTINTNRANIPN